jgi:hypothetical protein
MAWIEFDAWDPNGAGSYWGLTQITANDQVVLLRLLLNGNAILDPASRSYALKLMADGSYS